MPYSIQNGYYVDENNRKIGTASTTQTPEGNFSFNNGTISGPGGWSFDVAGAMNRQASGMGRALNPTEVNAWATNLADDAYRKQYGIEGAQLSRLGAAAETGLRDQVTNWAKTQTFQPNALAGGNMALTSPQQRTAGQAPQDNRSNVFALPQSTVQSPGMQVANDPGAVQAAQTGVGAGRGYPSNWNANNAPGLASSGEGTTFATNPATGASYETSPMYQWQLKQGEKSINRAARSRGRFNSSVNMNTLANFYNQLGAQEADKQYGRTFDQQKLGLQAALAEASQRGQLTGQLGSLYGQLGGAMAGGSERYGGSIADLIRQYAAAEGANVLGAGTQAGDAQMWAANPTAKSFAQTGQNTAGLADILAALGLRGWENYQKR